MTIALVTGGSRGLGKSAALQLAKQGHDVILTYHTQQQEAQAVAQQITELGQRAAIISLNVARSGSFSQFSQDIAALLAQQWQRKQFDYLINNAGIGIYAAFVATDEKQFDQLVNIHLKGPFFLSQALLPLLRDGGVILNISTGLTRFTLPGYAAYAMMKGGVEVMTRYLAKELGARHIRVNTIAPGAIETDFAGGMVRDNEAANQFIASQTALGRVGLPDDIGQVIASMVKQDNYWINGQRIEASGGQSL